MPKKDFSQEYGGQSLSCDGPPKFLALAPQISGSGPPNFWLQPPNFWLWPPKCPAQAPKISGSGHLNFWLRPQNSWLRPPNFWLRPWQYEHTPLSSDPIQSQTELLNNHKFRIAQLQLGIIRKTVDAKMNFESSVFPLFITLLMMEGMLAGMQCMD